MATLSDLLGAANNSFALVSAVRKPDVFNHETHEQEVAHWDTWSNIFRNWICCIEPHYETDFSAAEARSVPIGVDQLTKEGRARSIKLYAILTSYIVGRSSKLLRNVQHSNGIETWRRLTETLAPQTRQRGLSILQNICQLSPCKKPLDCVTQLENLMVEYERVTGKQVFEDIC